MATKATTSLAIHRWDGGEAFKAVAPISISMEGVSHCCSNYLAVHPWMEGMSDRHCHHHCTHSWANKREGRIGFLTSLCCGC
uniref:Uncharacterized protein n=1 Tax=Physcomitrium patens TaxID=3218 RepID=A0A7I3Z0A6_PHYPA